MVDSAALGRTGEPFIIDIERGKIREFARARGTTSTYIPIVLPEMRVDEEDLALHLDRL